MTTPNLATPDNSHNYAEPNESETEQTTPPEPSKQLLSFTVITGIKPTRLTKIIGLNAKGGMRKETSAMLSQGQAQRVFVADLHGLKTHLDTLNSAQAVTWGVTKVAAKAMVEGLVVTNTAPKEKAASGLLTTKQPDSCNAPAHADDANGLNLPKKKRRSQAFVMPAARAVPTGCALVRADAHDAQAPSVSELCGQPHQLHSLDEAADLLEQLGANHA